MYLKNNSVPRNRRLNYIGTNSINRAPPCGVQITPIKIAFKRLKAPIKVATSFRRKQLTERRNLISGNWAIEQWLGAGSLHGSCAREAFESRGRNVATKPPLPGGIPRVSREPRKMGKLRGYSTRDSPRPRTSSPTRSRSSRYAPTPREPALVRMVVSTRVITCLVHHKQRTWPDVMRAAGPRKTRPTSRRFNTRPRTVGSLSKCRKSNCPGAHRFIIRMRAMGSCANARASAVSICAPPDEKWDNGTGMFFSPPVA